MFIWRALHSAPRMPNAVREPHLNTWMPRGAMASHEWVRTGRRLPCHFCWSRWPRYIWQKAIREWITLVTVVPCKCYIWCTNEHTRPEDGSLLASDTLSFGGRASVFQMAFQTSVSFTKLSRAQLQLDAAHFIQWLRIAIADNDQSE